MKQLSKETMGLLIGRSQRLMQQAVVDLVTPHRITPQQLWILLMILDGDDLASGDVAARIHMDKATASRLIDRLVRRRWLKMIPSPADSRRLRLQLTTTGTKQAKKLARLALALDSQMLRGISAADLANAADTLRRVITNLGQEFTR